MLTLDLIAVIALPVMETGAVAVAARDEVRLFVNRPSHRDTVQLLVRGTTLQPLTPLPIAVAGAASCADETYLATGADPATGTPLVLSVNGNGAEQWRSAVGEPLPTRWPLPLCADRPFVIWQIEPTHLAVAEIGPGGPYEPRLVPIGGPPLEVAAAGGRVWALWSDGWGVHAREIGAPARPVLDLSARHADAVALVADGDRVRALWTIGRQAGTVLLPGDDGGPAEPSSFELPAEPGTLSLVAGPIVLGQRLDESGLDAPQWRAWMLRPGDARAQPVSAPVHAIVRQRDRLWMVGSTEIRVFKLGDDGPSTSS
jgi:hypothetical protein